MHFEARKGRALFGSFAPLPRVTNCGRPRATLLRRPDRIIVGESARCGSIRASAGIQHDNASCASAEQPLTRLAHYGVDSGTAGLSHGSVREAIAFAINMRNAAVSTIDATFVTSIAMTAAASGCRSAAAFG